MHKASKPVLIMTRSASDSVRFVDVLRKRDVPAFEAIIAPLLEIMHLPVVPLNKDLSHLVLTSVNGVAAAERMGIKRDILAWCVGHSTATAAKALGFKTRVSQGAGAELLSMMIDAHPNGEILYLRGRHTRIDISRGLLKAGIPCNELVAYDQVAQCLTKPAKSALTTQPVPILPLFSPRTAEILRAELPVDAQLNVVAMSQSIMDAFGTVGVQSHKMAKLPTETAMIAATVEMMQ